MTEVGKQTLARVGENVAEALADPEAASAFTRCMDRTLRRAVRRLDDGTAFVVTGDIPAMWLRDSAAQIRPYLRVCGVDPQLQDLVAGVLARQFRFVVTDPYANAFNSEPDGRGHHDDLTAMDPWVWERKYEIDSLCYPLQLAYQFWQITGRVDHFDDWFHRAASLVVATWTAEQDHENGSPYTFQRPGGPESDTLARAGRGPRTTATGMTWSGFRPSDDACRYGYHIPGNMFAVVVLGQLAQIAARVLGDDDLAARALVLRGEIDDGITLHGIVEHPEAGRIYAYEVDGLGGTCLMDDANVPSLLAAPLLGYIDDDDPLYLATRRFVLSHANPFYYAGCAAAGVGSPHTPAGHVWPIALAVAGLTATSRDERAHAITTLHRTGVGGSMHESFHCDQPNTYTRQWFSWADAMYCELVLQHCGYRLDQAVVPQ